MKKKKDDLNVFITEIDMNKEEYKNSIDKLNNAIKNSFSNKIISSKYINYDSFEKSKIDLEPSRLMRVINQGGSTQKLKDEISELEDLIVKKTEELDNKDKSIEEKTVAIDNLTKVIDDLNSKQRIQHLLNSVTDRVHTKILEDENFRNKFSFDGEAEAFVVSVDIRRSTELMLKAKTPKLFADFITTLCAKIEDIFKENFGVVDKFTGDGILAFFPTFFSGDDSGYYALDSAKKSIIAFQECYKEYRTSFNTILRDVGLGIGVDYGSVHFVQMAGNLTIVGRPVVYACRMGGAPANRIFINQPAFEKINERYSSITNIEESFIEIKHEGSLICYDVNLTNKKFSPAEPDWFQKNNI